MAANDKPDSIVKLRLDVASARVLVWVARAGRDVELTSEADQFFFERYQRLAACYRRRGNEHRALAMELKAEQHARHGGWDGPPYAAAMSLPRPAKWITTDAVSRRHIGGPPNAA